MLKKASRLIEISRERGASGALRHIGERISGKMLTYRDARFDRRYGVETADWVTPEDFRLAGPSVDDAIRYEPIGQALFHRMMGSVPVRCSECVFVDVGSGKGKAVMLAARYPFKRVIGIEFAPEIHRVAQANIAAFRRARRPVAPIELVCRDATNWPWPTDDLLVFLYNPFVGDTFRRVLVGLTRSLAIAPRRILIFYRNPVCAGVIEAFGVWRPLVRHSDYHVYGSP